MPADPLPTGELAPETCPGCGAVLAPVTRPLARPGASASCARLFEVTLRGLRDEAPSDTTVAVALRRADSAYQLQHSSDVSARPASWRMTIADVAADLDVVDLPVLVGAWADAVDADLASAGRP